VRRGGLAVALLAALTLAAPAHAARSIASPDHAIVASIKVAGGTATLAAIRNGRTVATAELGPTGRITGVRRSRLTSRYSTPAGKRRSHVLRARRMTVRLRRAGPIQVLAANDGIAFRRRGPQRDSAAWRATGRVWLQRLNRSYENAYDPVAMSRAQPGRYGFPALLRTAGGWALLTESGLPYGAAAAHLRVTGDHRLAVEPQQPSPTTTGWRVAVIGRLSTIVGSDLPLSLGRRSQVSDTSWIHPGRASWSWWSDASSPERLSTQKQFVAFAASEHFEYTTVDEGWHASWVPNLVAYARARAVRLLLWTDWRALADPKRRAATLDRWAGWGIAGIKVDFLLSDSGARMAVMEDIARAAAQRHLVVDFHGCTVPRGIQRTWPNVLSLEAVRGAEYQRDGTPSSPDNNVDLAFTRNVLGSMDYTPVTFSARHRITSAGHELAMAVVYESGLVHYADSPQSYRRYPTAASVMAGVPAAWDDTRLVAGGPDRFVTIARRSGTSWYVGSLSSGPARTLRVPLRFLGGGRYSARIVADDGAGGLTDTHAVVTAADTLYPHTAANGGAVIELTPLALGGDDGGGTTGRRSSPDGGVVRRERPRRALDAQRHALAVSVRRPGRGPLRRPRDRPLLARARPADVDVPPRGRPGGFPGPARAGAGDRRGRGARARDVGPPALPVAHAAHDRRRGRRAGARARGRRAAREVQRPLPGRRGGRAARRRRRERDRGTVRALQRAPAGPAARHLLEVIEQRGRRPRGRRRQERLGPRVAALQQPGAPQHGRAGAAREQHGQAAGGDTDRAAPSRLETAVAVVEHEPVRAGVPWAQIVLEVEVDAPPHRRRPAARSDRGPRVEHPQHPRLA
jgi:alpha-glucosidase